MHCKFGFLLSKIPFNRFNNTYVVRNVYLFFLKQHTLQEKTLRKYGDVNISN